MSTILISKCHREIALEDYKDNPRDHHDPIAIYRCPKCHEECDVEEVCDECLGTGEVTVDEQVYAGEPHMAPIGTRTCICKLPDEDDYQEEQ